MALLPSARRTQSVANWICPVAGARGSSGPSPSTARKCRLGGWFEPTANARRRPSGDQTGAFTILAAHHDAVQRLAEISGVDSAQQIIAEVGATAATFPSPKHLASWMGACPANEESAGVSYSHRCPKGNRQLRRVLNQAANAAVKAKGTIFAVAYPSGPASTKWASKTMTLTGARPADLIVSVGADCLLATEEHRRRTRSRTL